MDMRIVDVNTDRKEVQRIGYTIGAGLMPWWDAADYPHLCSELIHMNFIQILLKICDKFSVNIDDITNDRVAVYNFVQGRAACETLMYILPMFGQPGERLALSAEDMARCGRLDDMAHKVTADIYTFCLWAIWYGAKPASKRIFINNKASKVLQKCIATYGHKGIIDLTWCACTAYVILCDKVMQPILDKMRRCEDDRNINAIKTKRIAPAQAKDNRGDYVNDIHNIRNLLRG